MKIAFFSNCYRPYLSGITVSIKSFREWLEKLGHTIFVVGPKYPGHQEKDPKVLRFPSLPATYPGYRFVLPFSPRIYRKLREEKINLIHAQQPFGVGLAALWFARRLKIPIVYSFHTLFSRYVHNAPFVPQKLAKSIVAKYLTFFCNRVDTVVVPSEMVRRLLVLRKVKTPIKVIPTGINAEEIQAAKQPKTRLPRAQSRGNPKLETIKELGLPEGAKILLYTGRVSAEKNIPFLLKAFQAIRQQEKNTYLILVGGGPKLEEYKKLGQELDAQIIFVGQKSRQEVLRYCFAADLFVYASVTETQGLVLSEAKACGLPVVAVFGGGISDVIESGLDGYLVAQNQGKFVAHVLRLLRDESLRKKMSLKAQEDALKRFDASVVAKKMESVYNALVPKGGLSSATVVKEDK